MLMLSSEIIELQCNNSPDPDLFHGAVGPQTDADE